MDERAGGSDRDEALIRAIAAAGDRLDPATREALGAAARELAAVEMP